MYSDSSAAKLMSQLSASTQNVGVIDVWSYLNDDISVELIEYVEIQFTFLNKIDLISWNKINLRSWIKFIKDILRQLSKDNLLKTI